MGISYRGTVATGTRAPVSPIDCVCDWREVSIAIYARYSTRSYHGSDSLQYIFGWTNAVDTGYLEGYLGGVIFRLFHDSYYTSLWAR